MRREPRIPRYMAIRPGQRMPQPDNVWRDVAVVAVSIVLLIVIYFMAGAVPR
jgi:hypothetical protein